MLVPLDQALFGYDDGHRLLASSLRLDTETTLELTALSDLAPGVRFGDSDGYWTGVPLPKIGRYALMRTWPAPEMPRPGTVWTHVLFLRPDQFEGIPSLRALMPIVRRPEISAGLSAYLIPLEAQIATGAEPSSRSLDHQYRALDILDRLYGGRAGPVPSHAPGELDNIVFEIWSQQWPKLRRNFRFQTASAREVSAVTGRFDLQFQEDSGFFSDRETARANTDSTWLVAAVKDLDDGPAGSLRQFLWRYGTDVKRQRSSFRPLCEIYIAADSSGGEHNASELPQRVSHWFSDREDALRLKTDLVNGDILENCQLDFVSYLLLVDKGDTLPLPSDRNLGKLKRFLSSQAERVFDLGEIALGIDGPLAAPVLALVADCVPPAHFWSTTNGRPNLRRNMLEKEPYLFVAEDNGSVDTSTYLGLLDLVPYDHPVRTQVVRGKLATADLQTAHAFVQRFPDQVVSEVLAAIDGQRPVAQSWMAALGGRVDLLLSPSSLGQVSRTSTLYEVADTLGWLSRDVVRAGIEPWVAGLDAARDDLSTQRSDELRAFILALALMNGGATVIKLFEQLFEPVHRSVADSRLPWRAVDMLTPLLPNVEWYDRWDTGLRLRMAVAAAYVTNDLPAESYANLSHDPKTLQLLAEAAQGVKGGRRLAKAIWRS